MVSLLIVISIALVFGSGLGVGMFFLYKYAKRHKRKDLLIGVGSLGVVVLLNFIIPPLLPAIS